jgi:hypothetical protein
MNLIGVGDHVSIGEMAILGGVAVKVIWEVFRNRQQDKDSQRDRDENFHRHTELKRKVDNLHSYVTNGVDAPGGGLSAKFVTRREYVKDHKD